MYVKAFAASATILALSAIQSCPAPPLAIGLLFGVGVPLAGNLLYIGLNGNVKRVPTIDGFRVVVRQDEYPPELPESARLAYDECKAQNGDGRSTTVTRLAENSFQITSVAPACMTVATYFTDAATPYPCGNDCLQYDNLTQEGIDGLMEALRQLGKV